MVYSPYEHRVLAELGRDFPKYENALAGLRGRLFDLLPVIRSSYTHPAMPNNSLKSVPPVLVPGGGTLVWKSRTALRSRHPAPR